MGHCERTISNIGVKRIMIKNNPHFTPVDEKNWARKEYFYHYLNAVPCTYQATVQIDITPLHQKKLALYPTMIYLLSKVVNQYKEFKLAYHHQILGYYEVIHPSYTLFNPKTQQFCNVDLHYDGNYHHVLEQYYQNKERYGECASLFPKKDTESVTFNISMIPWLSFSSFQLNLPKGMTYFQPMITMGKYEEREGRIYLPISFQVHHSVCDGYHLSQCINQLQTLINDWQ